MNFNPGVIMLLVSAVAAQPMPPQFLEQGLRTLPGLRLLDPAVDLVGGYTVEQLNGFGNWPPWVMTNVDRDGRSDVVAVVVKPGTRPQFGVIAVHAGRQSFVQWVSALGDDPINGVAAGPARDTYRASLAYLLNQLHPHRISQGFIQKAEVGAVRIVVGLTPIYVVDPPKRCGHIAGVKKNGNDWLACV